jgi:hypothetical protein
MRGIDYQPEQIRAFLECSDEVRDCHTGHGMLLA